MAADSTTFSATNVQLCGWSTDDVAPDHVATTDESVNSLWSNVYIGRDQANTVNTSPTVSVDAGAHVGTVSVFNNSHATITGGQMDNSVYVQNNATLDVTGGSIAAIQTFDNSQVNVAGGHVSGLLSYSGTTTVSNGGSVDYIIGYDKGTVNLQSGHTTYIAGYGTSVSNISGGSVSDSISVLNNAQANITGGTLTGVALGSQDNGIVRIYGTNLSSAFAGRIQYSDGLFYNLYNLGGQLQDGSSLSGVVFLDYDGGLQIGDPRLGDANNGNLRFFGTFAATAPEPGSLLLLGAGLLPAACVLRRKRS